jgi:Serpin (serine protease inhibitor)
VTAAEPVNALTRRWAATADGRSMVLAGPGVWPLLALLDLAADETAHAQLAAALGGPADAADAVLDLLAESPAVRFAIGLWSRADLPLHASWLGRLPPGVHGELTGRPDADQGKLDAWASEHTDGLIKRMPIQVASDTVLVLASGMVVRTRWVEPFRDGTITPGSGPWAGRQLAGLHRTTYDLAAVAVIGSLTRLRVAGTDGIDVCLFLGEAEPGEVLARGLDTLGDPGGPLPDGRPGPGVEVGMVTATDARDRCTAVLPRFAVDANHDLMALPDVFGLRAISEPGHLPGISTRPVALSQGRQDAVAEFTAEGFYAAAVTAFALRTTAMRVPSTQAREVRVTFDRPFGFAAVHRESGLVLVAGWVADPEAWHPPIG